MQTIMLNRQNLLPLGHDYIIVGDVHGCIDELKSLLMKQGLTINNEGLIEITPQTPINPLFYWVILLIKPMKRN